MYAETLSPVIVEIPVSSLDLTSCVIESELLSFLNFSSFVCNKYSVDLRMVEF